MSKISSKAPVVKQYLFSRGIYGTQSIFICFMGIISSASLWTELIPILSEGGKGDTTYKIKNHKQKILRN